MSACPRCAGAPRLTTATIYRKVNAGTFPRQIKLSANCVGWYESDLNAWVSDPASWGERDGVRIPEIRQRPAPTR